MSARDEAADLLVFYMRRALEGTALGWHRDNETEIRNLVDRLMDAVNDEIRAHAEDAPHLYADGSTG